MSRYSKGMADLTWLQVLAFIVFPVALLAALYFRDRRRNEESYLDDAGTQQCPDGRILHKLLDCRKMYPPGTPGTPLGRGSSDLVSGYKTCRDGTPVPLNFSCQDGVQQCNNGRIVSKNMSCTTPFIVTPAMMAKQKSKICPDGTTYPVEFRCDEATQQCPDGRVISKYKSCTTGKSLTAQAPPAPGVTQVTPFTATTTSFTAGGDSGVKPYDGGSAGTALTDALADVSTSGTTGGSMLTTGTTTTGTTATGTVQTTGMSTTGTVQTTGTATPATTGTAANVSQCVSKCASKCAASSQCATMADVNRLVAAVRKRNGAGASLEDAMRLLDAQKKGKPSSKPTPTSKPGTVNIGGPGTVFNCKDGSNATWNAKTKRWNPCPGEDPNLPIPAGKLGNYGLYFRDLKTLWKTGDAAKLFKLAGMKHVSFTTAVQKPTSAGVDTTDGGIHFTGVQDADTYGVVLSGKATQEIKVSSKKEDKNAYEIIFAQALTTLKKETYADYEGFDSFGEIGTPL